MAGVPTSLFLVTRTLGARVDVDARGRCTHAQVLSAVGVESTLVLRQLLALGPSPQSRCGVLLEELYARTVDVPSRAAELLPASELARWHALHLESQSGIAVERAQVAFTRLGFGSPDRHRVWVAIGDRVAHARMADALRAGGATSAWVASPAGVLDPGVDPTIEVWSGATHCGGGGTPRVVAGGTLEKRRCRRSVARWLTLVPHARVRLCGPKGAAAALQDERIAIAAPVVTPENAIERLLGLARTSDAELVFPRVEWFDTTRALDATAARSAQRVAPAAWPDAGESTGSAAITLEPPALEPVPFEPAHTLAPAAAPAAMPSAENAAAAHAERETPSSVRSATRWEAAIVALALCAAVLWLFAPRLRGTPRVVAAEVAPAELALRRALELERTRTLALLDALRDETSDKLVLARLRRVERHYEIDGVAESAAAADDYARALAARLSSRGWNVGAPRGARAPASGAAELWSWSLPLEPRADTPEGAQR